MTKLKSILLAATVLASVSTAHAKVEYFARKGAWFAFLGTSDSGVPICGMSIIGGEGRHAMVKWSASSNGLFMHIAKQGWSIPAGTEMPIAIQFDRAEPFSGTAVSKADDNGRNSNMVELSILDEDGSGENTKSFLNQFMAADKMYVSFPGGNEVNWVARMDGSETIAKAFMRCIANAPTATQPHADKKTQPYGGGSTQPFGGNKKPATSGGGFQRAI